ncbi:unnamed protein product [Didymodactylos carnosus]|uniref:Multiple inositol polyphosphate phosphatase 1 n=1 Tax=Didymodactylos carnosus TaxID=1234261 RepID=A0A814ZDW4_9BILA|nr:unnamed protein product [Didymodactylos carnosus]CAF4002975.1 unnamed protein product [Didymodactylos carnosus]
MGKDVLSIRTVQHWFNRFNNDNFELDDLPHSGRPLEVDMDVLQQLVDEDPRLTTWCLAERLGCCHTTVERHLDELGKTWKYGAWIPHDLSPPQLQHRVDACMELMTSHRNSNGCTILLPGMKKSIMGGKPSVRVYEELPMPTKSSYTPKSNPRHDEIEDNLTDLFLEAAKFVLWKLIPMIGTFTPPAQFFIYVQNFTSVVDLLSTEDSMNPIVQLMKKMVNEESARSALALINAKILTIESRLKDESATKNNAAIAANTCEEILHLFDSDNYILWDISITSSSVLIPFSAICAQVIKLNYCAQAVKQLMNAGAIAGTIVRIKELLPHPSTIKIEKETNILNYWKLNETQYPILAQLAKQVLCIPATNTAIERLFSYNGNATIGLLPQKCQPVAIWFLSRHAYRYPNKRGMNRIQKTLGVLKVNLVSSSKVNNVENTRKQFEHWQMKFDPIKHDRNLADIGNAIINVQISKNNLKFEQKLQRLRERYGLSKKQFDAKILEQVRKTCAYETSIYEQTSVWCKLLTIELNEFKEYEDDLKHNCQYGYKYPINYEQTCNLMKQFHKDLRSVLKKPQNHFYFGHAATLTTFLTRLDLYKDPYVLDFKHFRQKNRWKTSLISPMNTNIMFVLYKSCQNRSFSSNNGDYWMQIIHNQHIVIPKGCNGEQLCDVYTNNFSFTSTA